MSETAVLESPADPLSAVDLDALADKLAERMKGTVPKVEYQLLAFTIIGKELRATVKTPGGEVYQGVVTDWQKVTVVEVPK